MRGSAIAAIAIPALIAGAVIAAGCETIYAPTAPTNDWVTYESARFTIYAHPNSFAAANGAALTGVLEDQYTHTMAMLGIPQVGRISMFLYNQGSELHPPLPNARAGVAFPETNAVHAVAFAPQDDDLNAMLTHEANHVIIVNALGRPGTSFMNEGLASAVISERYGSIGPMSMHRWAHSNPGRVMHLSMLIDDAKWDSNSNDAYRSSASFLAFVLERYGAERLKQIYYAHSDDMAARMQAVYGKPVDALEGEWLGSL